MCLPVQNIPTFFPQFFNGAHGMHVSFSGRLNEDNSIIPLKRWKLSCVKKIRLKRRIAMRSGKGNNPLNIKTAVELQIWKLGLPYFRWGFYFIFLSLHPSFLDVFLWRHTWHFPALHSFFVTLLNNGRRLIFLAIAWGSILTLWGKPFPNVT